MEQWKSENRKKDNLEYNWVQETVSPRYSPIYDFDNVTIFTIVLAWNKLLTHYMTSFGILGIIYARNLHSM
jgi:hypothetical protein